MDFLLRLRLASVAQGRPKPDLSMHFGRVSLTGLTAVSGIDFEMHHPSVGNENSMKGLKGHCVSYGFAGARLC